jgi:hypothetical protein
MVGSKPTLTGGETVESAGDVLVTVSFRNDTQLSQTAEFTVNIGSFSAGESITIVGGERGSAASDFLFTYDPDRDNLPPGEQEVVVEYQGETLSLGTVVVPGLSVDAVGMGLSVGTVGTPSTPTTATVTLTKAGDSEVTVAYDIELDGGTLASFESEAFTSSIEETIELAIPEGEHEVCAVVTGVNVQ